MSKDSHGGTFAEKLSALRDHYPLKYFLCKWIHSVLDIETGLPRKMGHLGKRYLMLGNLFSGWDDTAASLV